MNKFAWVIPLRCVEDFLLSSPEKSILVKKGMQRNEVKDILLKASPYALLKLPRIKSLNGREVEGYVILCPLLPEQIVVEKENVLSKMHSVLAIARQLEVKILSLGGMLGLYSGKIAEIANGSGVAITNAKNYTSAIVTQALIKAATLMGKNPAKARIGIVGVSAPLGRVCAEILKNNFSNFIFSTGVDKDIEKDKDFFAKFNFIKTKYLSDLCKKSDIVLITTNSISKNIDPMDLKLHSVVCDAIPLFENVKQIFKSRKDVLAFEGTRVIHPSCFNWESNPRLEDIFCGRVIFSCISEAMILSFEGKFENYSLDNSLTVEKAGTIYQLGLKHGFLVSDLRCGSNLFEEKVI